MPCTGYTVTGTSNNITETHFVEGGNYSEKLRRVDHLLVSKEAVEVIYSNGNIKRFILEDFTLCKIRGDTLEFINE